MDREASGEEDASGDCRHRLELRRLAAVSGAMLVTVLGTNPKPARYALRESSVEAVLAPLALVQLVSEDQKPSRILALCTPEAKEQSWPILARGLVGSGIDAAVVEIAAAPTDMASFLRTVAGAIPAPAPAADLARCQRLAIGRRGWPTRGDPGIPRPHRLLHRVVVAHRQRRAATRRARPGQPRRGYTPAPGLAADARRHRVGRCACRAPARLRRAHAEVDTRA